MNGDVILRVASLSKYYRTYKSVFDLKKNIIKAVDGVSFEVVRGEIFSVVGETGCGKSTLARLITGLHDRTAGEIYYKGEELNYKKRRTAFRKNIQIVFQDPYSSLNPKKKIYKTVTYPAVKNLIISKKDRVDYAASLLKNVGLGENIINSYPHELSGGQRQRVGIARSLAVSPELLILDEPVSALDVSISAQVLNLLMDLREERSMTYIFITHDLNLVRHMADRVMVMYRGKIMEISTAEDFFKGPAHPYSVTLYNSMLYHDSGSPAAGGVQKDKGPGTESESENKGCVYFGRCYAAKEKCGESEPPLKGTGPKSSASCFFPFIRSGL